MITFIAGFLVGALTGICVTSLTVASKDREDNYEIKISTDDKEKTDETTD